MRETPAESGPDEPEEDESGRGGRSGDADGAERSTPGGEPAGSRGVTEQGRLDRDSTAETPAAPGSNEEGTREVSTSDDQGSTAVQDPGEAAEATSPETAPESPGAGRDSGVSAAESGGSAESGATSDPGGGPDSGSGADPADAAESGGAAQESRPGAGAARRATPRSLTFQITRTTMLAVFVVAVCTTPIAFAQPFPLLLPAFLIPAALAFALLRPRTVLDAEGVRTRLLFGETAFGWDELSSLRLDERRWLRAVLESGKEVRLPAVRVRDLPHLALMSGGRVPDPDSAADVPGASTGSAASGETAQDGTDTGSTAGPGDSAAAASPADSGDNPVSADPEGSARPANAAATGSSANADADAASGTSDEDGDGSPTTAPKSGPADSTTGAEPGPSTGSASDPTAGDPDRDEPGNGSDRSSRA